MYKKILLLIVLSQFSMFAQSIETQELTLYSYDEFNNEFEQTITAEKIDGHWLMDGDIILSVENLNAATYTFPNNGYWKDGLVPFEFDPESEYTQSEKTKLIDAMIEIEDIANVSFVNRTSQTHSYVSITKGNTCSATPGYLGDAIEHGMVLHWSCFFDHRKLLHELMHVLGFMHEQYRYDRDDYIEIQWDNMDEKYHKRFAKSPVPSLITSEEYGYNSVMHYHTYNYSNNGEPTMTKLDGSFFVPNSQGLVSSDINGLQLVYGVSEYLLDDEEEFEEMCNQESIYVENPPCDIGFWRPAP